MTRVDAITNKLSYVLCAGSRLVTALMFSCLVDEAARLGGFQPAISGVLDLLMVLYH